jgi:hypothetical protein
LYKISDAVNEISTDDGNLTGGSSQSDHTNPYSSLKRAPQKDVRQGPGQFPVKRAPNLGTSAFMGSDYGGESGPISGWRKYSLPQTNTVLISFTASLISPLLIELLSSKLKIYKNMYYK